MSFPKKVSQLYPTPINYGTVQVAKKKYLHNKVSLHKKICCKAYVNPIGFPLKAGPPPPQKKTPHLSASSGTLGVFFFSGEPGFSVFPTRRPSPLTFKTETRGTKAGPAPVRCAFALKTLAPPAVTIDRFVTRGPTVP